MTGCQKEANGADCGLEDGQARLSNTGTSYRTGLRPFWLLLGNDDHRDKRIHVRVQMKLNIEFATAAQWTVR